MIIINADDWGRSCEETESALSCFEAGRITSVSAMVFMEDSARAAGLAVRAGVDVGLHLNLSQRFTGSCRDPLLLKHHASIASFISASKYAGCVYRPALREAFDYAFRAQLDEFVQLYGRRPSHIDGHQHKHLCANMLLDYVIPAGEKVRRNFSFRAGEKSLLNRGFRQMQDLWLMRRYRSTDYFFALYRCLRRDELQRVARLSDGASVEIMAHPVDKDEFALLMCEEYRQLLARHRTGTYRSL